jgi:DNA-directed RNA polymerase I subunit RPA1
VITALLNYVIGDSSPLQLKSRCKIAAKLWGSCAPEEADVIFRQNEMLTGVLGKSQFGASKYGLVHAVHELYTPKVAGDLLTSLCRLFTSYLQFRGFTCGMDDLLLTAQAEDERTALIDRAGRVGTQVASAFASRTQYEGAEHDVDTEQIVNITAGMKDRLLSSERESEVLDGMMKGGMHETTSRIIGACLPDGQRKLFPLNNLSLMTVSGAKGSVVNFSQISCLLGQQELEGKRVPRMASGRTLPSFDPYDPSPRAGGFIGDRFLSGIRPQEYFFHCMAGREGLVDTAVKTANSGRFLVG